MGFLSLTGRPEGNRPCSKVNFPQVKDLISRIGGVTAVWQSDPLHSGSNLEKAPNTRSRLAKETEHRRSGRNHLAHGGGASRFVQACHSLKRDLWLPLRGSVWECPDFLRIAPVFTRSLRLGQRCLEEEMAAHKELRIA